MRYCDQRGGKLSSWQAIFSRARAQCIIALFVATFVVPASGQDTPPNSSGASGALVMPLSEAGELLQIKVGHSKLLQANQPFGTIIVGDDTIANATIGPGNSIVLTGLMEGSTNIIVLGETLGMMMATGISVTPLDGQARSAATVMKGAGTSERYECRGTGCTLVSTPGPTNRDVAPDTTNP